jgi:hypothetical protein
VNNSASVTTPTLEVKAVYYANRRLQGWTGLKVSVIGNSLVADREEVLPALDSRFRGNDG